MSGFEPDLKTRTKQMIAKSASSTNTGVKFPVVCRTAPRTSGAKHPSNPPVAPTSPVTAPTDGRRIIVCDEQALEIFAEG